MPDNNRMSPQNKETNTLIFSNLKKIKFTMFSERIENLKKNKETITDPRITSIDTTQSQSSKTNNSIQSNTVNSNKSNDKRPNNDGSIHLPIIFKWNQGKISMTDHPSTINNTPKKDKL